jgi:hypothetical protein
MVAGGARRWKRLRLLQSNNKTFLQNMKITIRINVVYLGRFATFFLLQNIPLIIMYDMYLTANSLEKPLGFLLS